MKTKLKGAALRVAIAQDVIKQLANKYRAESGTYLNIKGDFKSTKKDTSIQKLYKSKKVEKCYVCALGACFMSDVNINNKLCIKDVRVEDGKYLGVNSTDMRKKLRNIFSSLQMSMIESAFECTQMVDSDHNWDEVRHLNAAIRFGETYKTDRGRMGAIMRNIIKNQGTFVIPKKHFT